MTDNGNTGLYKCMFSINPARSEDFYTVPNLEKMVVFPTELLSEDAQTILCSISDTFYKQFLHC